MAKKKKKGRKSKLSAKQKAYLGANVWVHYKGGKVNTNASAARNRKYMRSSERKTYLKTRHRQGAAGVKGFTKAKKTKGWAGVKGYAKRI